MIVFNALGILFGCYVMQRIWLCRRGRRSS